MKMTSIIKTVVAVTAIVTVGKVVYDKVKTNKETESEEVKTTIDEVVEDDEPEPKKNIIEKAVDKFNNLSTDDQALVVTVAGAVVIGLGIVFVGHRYNRSLKNYKINQEYKKLRNNAWNDYMNSKDYQYDIEQATNEIMNIVLPSPIDKYITEFMKKDLANDPEHYDYYINNKLFVNLTYACYFCKVLESDLLTPEQAREVCDSTIKELEQYI